MGSHVSFLSCLLHPYMRTYTTLLLLLTLSETTTGGGGLKTTLGSKLLQSITTHPCMYIRTHSSQYSKPVYNDHSRNQVMVVSVDRWSLYRGAFVLLRWTMEQTTVVTVDRWSLYRGAFVLLRWTMEQTTVVTVDRWSLYRGAFVLLRWTMEQTTVVTVDWWSCYTSGLYNRSQCN